MLQEIIPLLDALNALPLGVGPIVGAFGVLCATLQQCKDNARDIEMLVDEAEEAWAILSNALANERSAQARLAQLSQPPQQLFTRRVTDRMHRVRWQPTTACRPTGLMGEGRGGGAGIITPSSRSHARVLEALVLVYFPAEPCMRCAF